jgi:hypothetical protein
MALLAWCWYRTPLGERCRRRASEVRGSHAYCVDHAAMRDAITPIGRSMRSNPHGIDEEQGPIEPAIAAAIAHLEAAAASWLSGNASRLSVIAPSDPAGWVAGRMGIRYSQEPPQADTPNRWTVAASAQNGWTAKDIIDEALHGLVGSDDSNAFRIPGRIGPTTKLGSHLERLYRLLDAGQRNKAIASQAVELVDAEPEAKAVMKEMAKLHARLPELLRQMGAHRYGHRSPNTVPDAAAVLLAGCWWLAVGRWPAMSNVGKGGYYDWALKVLMTLRPDLLQPRKAGRDMAPVGLGRSIKRRGDVVPSLDNANDLPGPWLAWRVLAERAGN